MDPNRLREKLKPLLQKYGLFLSVLLAGIFLMLFPGTSQDTLPEPVQLSDTTEESFEAHLSRLLSRMDGAGEVQVFLSLRNGSQTLYQTNESYSGGDLLQETVVITASDRSQTGLVQRIDPPVYQGAVVLCRGADNAAVRLAITQAVANATGLGTNQISVLKMK